MIKGKDSRLIVMAEIKNYGKSNRTKLLNLARKTKGVDYNLILLRFVQERFLYRLSMSDTGRISS